MSGEIDAVYIYDEHKYVSWALNIAGIMLTT